MLDGLLNVAAGIRHRLHDDDRLQQFEQRIISRLGLLAHVVIRSGSDTHLTMESSSSAAESVARDAIDGLARGVGFADANVPEIVDYGVILVLIALHVCRQKNLKGDDVLEHVRHLLRDAAQAVPALTPAPSFSDEAAVAMRTPDSLAAGVLMHPDPTWSLISGVIAKLRAEINQVQVPPELLTTDFGTVQPATWQTTTPDRLLLTDGPPDADPDPVSTTTTANLKEIQAPVLPIEDDDQRSLSPPPSSTRATIATTEMESVVGMEALSPSAMDQHGDSDDDGGRDLQEVLAVLARLQTGQDHMTEELRQLKRTIEEASGAACGDLASESLHGSVCARRASPRSASSTPPRSPP